MHRNDVLSIIALVVGIASLAADSTFSGELTQLFGASAPKILAVLGLIGTVGSQVIRVISVPTPTPPVQTKGTSH